MEGKGFLLLLISALVLAWYSLMKHVEVFGNLFVLFVRLHVMTYSHLFKMETMWKRWVNEVDYEQKLLII